MLMKCPFCTSEDSKVIDSRDVNDGIRRRRQCLKCEGRFTTYERLQPSGLYVVKKDQRREEFNKEKLAGGIRKACEKRPMPARVADKLADEIESKLYQSGKIEVKSTDLGDIVMDKLKYLDDIAYIRFASVYRKFTDITELKREVDTLITDESETNPSSSQLPLIVTGSETKARHNERGQAKWQM